MDLALLSVPHLEYLDLREGKEWKLRFRVVCNKWIDMN